MTPVSIMSRAPHVIGMADAESVVRAYYRALDDHDYDRLADLLAPDAVQRRPDRTFEGREALVSFMREGRPETETTHDVRAVYVADGAAGESAGGTESADRTDEVAVRGRVLTGTDETLVRFVDVVAVENGRIAAIDTYTR